MLYICIEDRLTIYLHSQYTVTHLTIPFCLHPYAKNIIIVSLKKLQVVVSLHRHTPIQSYAYSIIPAKPIYFISIR